LQRLGEVRRREGLPRGKVARRLGISVRQVQEQEEPSSDMSLSDLYRWQEALGVPAAELLHEPDGDLSPPVQLRSRLLRAMKTARLIEEMAQQTSIRRLVKSLINQLVDAMPELKETTAWPAVGHRRKQDELGQAFFRRLSLDFFVAPEPQGDATNDLC
jgi:transcriptional regulator with XRE-family HTH domain